MKWTAGKILKWSIDHLTKAGVQQPLIDSEVLIAEAISPGKRHIAFLEPSRPVDQKKLLNCQNWIKRRALREPVNYIIGCREFWSLNFKVTPEVLIPRPETETLVEQLLKLIQGYPKKDSLKVLDIGTGSGNIVVAVAKEIPDCHITAIDISEGALAVARENAKAQQVFQQIRFLKSNLFEVVRRERLGPFHFIVSNPPYIDTKQLENLIIDVKGFEPRLALDGGENGLDVYRQIIPQVSEFLEEQGWLILEIGFDQAEFLSHLIEEAGIFDEPEVHLDYSGHPRVVTARKRVDG